MQALVAKAVIDGMTDDQRAGFIQAAIQEVLKRQTGSSYDKRSAFQQAFDRAVEVTAQRIATDMIENDATFKGQVKALFVDACAKLFDSSRREEMATNIAGVIEKALTKDRY